MLNDFMLLLSDEYRVGPAIQIKNDQRVIMELACYSSKLKELYCVDYQEKSNRCFLLTFSLLMNERWKLKIKRQLNITLQDMKDIKRVVIHKVNERQLGIICLNSLVIIKSINYIEEEEEVSYYKSYGNDTTIVDFSFTNYDDHYGVLLSNGHFYYDSINNHHQNNHLCFHIFHYANVISFNFFPLNTSGWENFMILFMGKDGQFYLSGPVFPYEFNINEEYLSIMKHKYQNKESYEILLSPIINGIYESSSQNGILIKSNPYLLNWNRDLMIREMIVNENTKDNQLNSSNNYKQFIILKQRPIMILRISSNNIIEVIIIAEDLQPIIKQGTHNTITISYNHMFIVERIDLLYKHSFPFGLVKCHDISEENIIIELMNNVYHISLPYRKTLIQFTNNANDYSNTIHINQFKSRVNQLIKNNDNNSCIIPLNFFFAGIILKGKFTIITYIKDSFKHYSIDIKENNHYHCEGYQLFNTTTMINTKEDKNHPFQVIMNPIQQNEESMRMKLNNQFSFRGIEYDNNNDDKINNEDCNATLLQNYNDMLEYSTELLNKLGNTFQQQQCHLLQLYQKRQIILQKFNYKNIVNYLNQIQEINALCKSITYKKEIISNKINYIRSILKHKKCELNPQNKVLIRKIVYLEKAIDQLSSSSIQTHSLIKHTMEDPSKRIQIPFAIEMNLITQSNISKGEILWNTITKQLSLLTQINNSLENENR